MSTTAREVRPGDCIMRHGKGYQIVTVTDVPEMHSVRLWYEEIGKGEALTLDYDDEIEAAE